MSNKKRFMTEAISELLSVELQEILWEIYDRIAEKRKGKMDYLQVFKMIKQNEKVIIINKQEMPQLTEEFLIINKEISIINDTIWIIDDHEYQTMLVPSEY